MSALDVGLIVLFAFVGVFSGGLIVVTVASISRVAFGHDEEQT